LIYDSGTPPHFSDVQLDTFLDSAVLDINIWGSFSYTVISLNSGITPPPDPSIELQKVYRLVLMYAQILTIRSDASYFKQFIKITTQDASIDPGDAGTQLSKFLTSLQDDFKLRLNKWIGIEDASLVWSEAGLTEY
jgi:hypothetical protein